VHNLLSIGLELSTPWSPLDPAPSLSSLLDLRELSASSLSCSPTPPMSLATASHSPSPSLPDPEIPHSDKALIRDGKLSIIQCFLTTLTPPPSLSDEEAHSVYPLLPFYILEATYLSSPQDFGVSTKELIILCASQLARCPQNIEDMWETVSEFRRKSIKQFENHHHSQITSFDFKPGALVLVCNSRIKRVSEPENKAQMHWTNVPARSRQISSNPLLSKDLHINPYHL